LESGVTLIDSLTVASRISKNTVFNNSVDEMKSRVSKGEPILLLAGKDATFPPLVAQMIRVGEETGDLDSMLLKVADFYEAELDSIVESMTAIIEPVIIVFLGVVLGGTLVALYMQLFNVVNVIQ
jgi:type IV pilus assembly protein PilC